MAGATDALTDTTVDREAEPESLAPAVTRAALILDVLAEHGVAAGRAERAGAAARPARSRPSPTSAAPSRTPGLVRRIGTGFALGRKVAELGGAYLASVDQVQEFYEAARLLPAASEETVQFAILDGLEVTYLARHDGRQPVRLTSGIGRRLPAFSTATGQGGAGVAAARRAGPAARRADHAAPAVRALPRDGRRRCAPTSTGSGRVATRSTTRRPWRASSATA